MSSAFGVDQLSKGRLMLCSLPATAQYSSMVAIVLGRNCDCMRFLFSRHFAALAFSFGEERCSYDELSEIDVLIAVLMFEFCQNQYLFTPPSICHFVKTQSFMTTNFITDHDISRME
jgi:hypothetical protein